MTWVQTIGGAAFVLAIYFGLVRRRHRQVLHPRAWIGEARSFRPSWNFLERFSALSCILVLFYMLIFFINEVVEVVAGVPSITPGSANPSAVLASISPWFLLAIGAALPVFEEWFFRFVIIDSTKKRLGTTGSVVLSAVLFGTMHLFNEGWTFGGFVAPFVGGLILAMVFLAGGLKSAIFIHSSNNFLITIFWMVR